MLATTDDAYTVLLSLLSTFLVPGLYATPAVINGIFERSRQFRLVLIEYNLCLCKRFQ
jgi:hypothetical protein